MEPPVPSVVAAKVRLAMGASGSVEAPDADELKRLFDKHDVTRSGNLERQEVPSRWGWEEW